MWQDLYIVLMVAGIAYYVYEFRRKWRYDERKRATLLAVNSEKSQEAFFVLLPATIFPVLGTTFLWLQKDMLMSLSFNLALAYWLVFLLQINRIVGGKK